MGWKNLPPLFCTATETVSDLANQALRAHSPSHLHKLDDRATALFGAASPTVDTTLSPLFCDPLLFCTNAQLLAYVDVFVDDFLGLYQGPTHGHRHVHRTLFLDLYKMFRLLDKLYLTHRKEVLYLKKLDSGYCSWST